MSEIRSFGLASVMLGDIPEDGTMSTTLAALGGTYQDSCDLVQDNPQQQDIYSEEADNPVLSLATKGKLVLKFSIMNYDPAMLAEVLGGTATAEQPGPPVVPASWAAPADTVHIEKSIQIITKTGMKIEIPRALIVAKINAQFRKRGVTLVDIEATALIPNASPAIAPITITAGS